MGLASLKKHYLLLIFNAGNEERAFRMPEIAGIKQWRTEITTAVNGVDSDGTTVEKTGALPVPGRSVQVLSAAIARDN